MKRDILFKTIDENGFCESKEIKSIGTFKERGAKNGVSGKRKR